LVNDCYLTTTLIEVCDELAHSPVRLPTPPRGRSLRPDLLAKLALLGAFVIPPLVKELAKLFRRNDSDVKAHVSDRDVGEAIEAYLRREMTLDELDTWITARTWDSAEAPSIAHEAELLIAETTRGDRTSEELDGELRDLAARRFAEA